MANETRQQATKRKHGETSRSLDNIELVFQGLATQDESQAVEVFRRIRAGHSVETILRHAQHIYVYQPITGASERRLHQSFLVTLAQSTAPLRDIIDLAASVLLNPTTGIKWPSEQALEPLKDRIVYIDTVCGILAHANPTLHLIGPSASSTSANVAIPDGSHDGPLFWVSAFPWTTMTDDDNAVSHLVSTFLTLFNPFWRCLEEDLFLRAMHSRNLTSDYCSPLLVHAILACASVI